MTIFISTVSVMVHDQGAETSLRFVSINKFFGCSSKQVLHVTCSLENLYGAIH